MSTLTTQQRKEFIDILEKMCPGHLINNEDVASMEPLKDISDKELMEIKFVKLSNGSLRWVKNETYWRMIEMQKNFYTNKEILDLKSFGRIGNLGAFIGSIVKSDDVAYKESSMNIIKSIMNDEGVDCTIKGGAVYKYKGRSYKVRKGTRGGNYILVKGEKIYIK
jgi:hypothetical protein